MECIRCKAGTAEVVAKAPDGSGAWEIYKCDRCNFGWRNTEPKDHIDPSKWDPYFDMTGVDIAELLIPCPIPPLKNK